MKPSDIKVKKRSVGKGSGGKAAAILGTRKGSATWRGSESSKDTPAQNTTSLKAHIIDLPTSAREGKNTRIPGSSKPQKRTFLP